MHMINARFTKRTVSIKLLTTLEQHQELVLLQKEFSRGCKMVAGIAFANQCYNRFGLHHLAYYVVRNNTDLGAQMACNTIRAVASANKALKNKKRDHAPVFNSTSSIHYDKRTYSIDGETISLYTLSGRIYVAMQVGDFQRNYLQGGTPKEAQLVYRKGQWYFNLVLDLAPCILDLNLRVPLKYETFLF
jgi:putative transposase